jgi:hypothetical protein
MYEELFHRRAAPLGHYIFADVDRLTHYEQEIAIVVADALRQASPEIRILNHPRWVLERFPLLRLLEQRGVNSFGVTRLDDGSRPKRYPVFVRCEDGHFGPDTDLLHSEAELEQTIADMRQRGRVLKRRIAVEFCAQRDDHGYYRKYGCINIGGRIVPQHVFESRSWMVKSDTKDRDPALAEAEMNYIRENPHRDALAEIFALAHIEYGRADYTLVDGKIQVYEINTNPNLPRISSRKGTSQKPERKQFFQQWMRDAFSALHTPYRPGPPVHFSFPEPQFHRMRTWTPEERSGLFRAWDRLVQWNPKWARRIPGRAWVRSMVRAFQTR